MNDDHPAVNGNEACLTERAAHAISALTALQVEALRHCGLDIENPADIPCTLTWRQGMPPGELAEEAIRAAAEHVSEKQAVRNGHVYCYACRTAACEHSRPTAHDHVFTGYESTGKPAWTELFNCLLFLRDDRTDLLFARPPKLLSRFMGGKQLVANQLPSFGRNSLTYRIWGQIVAGFLRLNDDRAALTAQLVETRDHRLHLQVILPDRFRDALAETEVAGNSAMYRVHDALCEAQRAVRSLSNAWQNAAKGNMRNQIRNRAFSTLRHLGHSIERKGRQSRRRTSHAEVRAAQQRPVHKAREDLAVATPEQFYRDVVRSSIIVAGKSGRIHVFGQNHKHITSMTVRGDELERRQRRKRYRALSTDEARAFQRGALAELADR